MSVSRTSSENISDRLTTAVMSVFARYITAGPTIMRTALRSLVARDIRSPVRFCLKERQRQPLEMREEVVAQVVLEAARRADDDAPHLIAEVPGDARRSAAGRPHSVASLVLRDARRTGRRRRIAAPAATPQTASSTAPARRIPGGIRADNVGCRGRGGEPASLVLFSIACYP